VEYDDQGLPAAFTDADGTVSRRAYDERGRTVAVSDPQGATTRYRYDQHGHPAAVVDPLGNTTTVVCDPRGLPLAVTDPLGNTTRYRYDPAGRVIESTDAAGALTITEWTPEGRPARQLGPDGAEQRWTWDAEGNCLSHTDGAGGWVRYQYGPFDLPVAKTASDGSRTGYLRDAELRLVGLVNSEGRSWTYRYDPAGRLAAETDFDGRVTGYAHDAAGRLTARTNPLGQRVTYTRDVLGRISEKADDQGRRTTFEYAESGVRRAAGPDAEVRFERDPSGRVLRETVTLAGQGGGQDAGRTTAHEFDALGRPVRRTTPSGVVSTWRYDVAGRPGSLDIDGRAVEFRYDRLGRETQRRIGDRLGIDLAWAATGQLTGQRVEQQLPTGTRLLRQRSFAYRADHYLTGITDSHAGHTDLQLDAAGRVTAVEGGDRVERYGYDAMGNQTHAEWPAVGSHDDDATGERRYRGTTLVRAGRVRYAHDAAGRMVLRQRQRLSAKPETWRYEWDAEDRLTAVITPDRTRWQYRYDPLGRRVAKQRLAADGSVAEQTEFSWSGATLIEQTSRAGETGDGGQDGTRDGGPDTMTWEFRGNQPVLQLDRRGRAGEVGGRAADQAAADQAAVDREFYAIVTDITGAPSQLVDEQGEIVWEPRATLWGKTPAPPPGAPGTPLRFPGQYADEESGLHYNVHRYYDPESARYLSPDPLGIRAAPNPHTYPHNPYAWSDPLGLAPCMVDLYHGTFGAAARNIRTNGIDLSYGRAAGDFGTGGFYVTNDAAQARQWADRLAAGRGDVPEVLHYRVPRSELEAFNARTFSGPGDDLADFTRHHRAGGDMHDYDLVEGPLLLNPDDFVPGNAPPVFGGHQIAIFTPETVDLFNRSLQ
jgi:RHS repeat-associated protein